MTQEDYYQQIQTYFNATLDELEAYPSIFDPLPFALAITLAKTPIIDDPNWIKAFDEWRGNHVADMGIIADIIDQHFKNL